MFLSFTRWAFIICALAITMSGVAAQDTPTPDGDKLGAGVAAAAFSEPEGVRVIVSLRAPITISAAGSPVAAEAVAAAQAEVVAEVPGLIPEYTYDQIPAMVATVTEEELAALQTNPDVVYVQLDERIVGHSAESVPALGANIVQDVYGITGAGVRVAVLDSGVDTDHPFIVGSIVAQKCFVQGATVNDAIGECLPGDTVTGDSAEDENGHGTNVTGVITSNNATYKGFAPNSEIVSVRVLGANNGGWVSDWIAGLDWLIANQGTLNVKIVNMSLGTNALATGNCDGTYPATANALAQLNALGIIVFASSGNQGSSTSLASPACNSYVVAVGATYDSNLGAEPDTGTYNSLFGGSWPACSDATTSLFTITCFSNSNAMLDILAPGARITNAYLNGGVGTYRGTSQASPTAAGIAALMKQTKPSLTPAQIEALMKSTGTGVTDAKNGLTIPAINARTLIQNVAIPALINPVNDLVIATLRPTFSWQGVYIAQSYELQIGRDNPPTISYTVTGSSELTLGWDLTPDTYFWRVRTNLPGGDTSPWSEIRTLELQTPQNYLPLRNIYTASSVTVTWNRVTYAHGYQIQIARDAAFTNMTYESNTLPSSALSTSVGSLQSGLYHWRVRALKPDGTWGAWGIVQTFYVDLY